MGVKESTSPAKEEIIATVVVATLGRETVTTTITAISNIKRTSLQSARISAPTNTSQVNLHARIPPTTISFANVILSTIV